MKVSHAICAPSTARNSHKHLFYIKSRKTITVYARRKQKQALQGGAGLRRVACREATARQGGSLPVQSAIRRSGHGFLSIKEISCRFALPARPLFDIVHHRSLPRRRLHEAATGHALRVQEKTVA